MSVTMTCRKLVERIRARLVDDTAYWSDTEILETADQQYVTLWDNLRRANRYHNLDRTDLLTTDFATIEDGWIELELPAAVQDIVLVQGLRAQGEPLPVPVAAADTFNMDLYRDLLAGSPAWMRGRYGRVLSIFGRGPYEAYRLWFIRNWPPMHFGATTSNGVNASLILDNSGPAPGGTQAGTVIVKDGAYIGMEVYIHEQDEQRRITGYTGSTRTATFDALPANLTTGDTYSLIVPVEFSMQRYFTELVLQDLILRLGNTSYAAAQAIVVAQLEEQMMHAGSDQDRANPPRLWSTR